MELFDRREWLRLAGGASASLFLTHVVGCGDAASEASPFPASATPPSPAGAIDASTPPPTGDAAAATATELADTGPALPRRFPTSMMTAGREELDEPLQIISGKLPGDIYGHAFIVSGLPWGDGSPVANGDGMIYRVDFGGASVGLKTRICKTPCYFADLATAGKANGFQNKGMVRTASGLGVRNEANTAFLAMGDRMLVTFDAGRPYEIDTKTLDLVTPVGWNNEWTQGLPDLIAGLMGGPFPPYFSTAHPAYDEHTKQVFTLNYVTGMGALAPGKVFVMRWDGAGPMDRWEVVLPGDKPITILQSSHQMAVTDQYIILCDTAFLIEPDQVFNQETVKVEAPETNFYVIKRSELGPRGGKVTATAFVIPREVAHFLVDYENPGGKIVLHTTHGSGWLPSEWLRKNDVTAHDGAAIRAELAGMLVTSSDLTPIARYVIDGGSGAILESKIVFHDDFTWSVALYAHRGTSAPAQFEDLYWTSVGFQPELLTKRVYDLSKSHAKRKVPLQQLPFGTGKRASLMRTSARSLDDKDVDGYVFPDGRAVSSPQFVPANGRAGSRDGYILCTVMSDDKSTKGSSGDELWIFDGRNLAQGPLCRLGHPRMNLGYTLHTSWLPEVKARTASYKVSVKPDFEPLVEKASAEVKDLFAREIYPKFV